MTEMNHRLPFWHFSLWSVDSVSKDLSFLVGVTNHPLNHPSATPLTPFQVKFHSQVPKIDRKRTLIPRPGGKLTEKPRSLPASQKHKSTNASTYPSFTAWSSPKPDLNMFGAMPSGLHNTMSTAKIGAKEGALQCGWARKAVTNLTTDFKQAIKTWDRLEAWKVCWDKMPG